MFNNYLLLRGLHKHYMHVHVQFLTVEDIIPHTIVTLPIAFYHTSRISGLYTMITRYMYKCLKCVCTIAILLWARSYLNHRMSHYKPIHVTVVCWCWRWVCVYVCVCVCVCVYVYVCVCVCVCNMTSWYTTLKIIDIMHENIIMVVLSIYRHWSNIYQRTSHPLIL